MEHGFEDIEGYSGLIAETLERVCLTKGVVQFNFTDGTFINYSGILSLFDAGSRESWIYDTHDLSSPLFVGNIIGFDVVATKVDPMDVFTITFSNGISASFASSSAVGYETWVLTEPGGRVFTVS